MLSILWKIIKIVLIITLPFIVLVRGSSFFHENYNLGAYPSILAALASAAILLFVYMTVIYSKITKRIGDSDNLARRLFFAFLLVAGYVGYGLFFLSPSNFKQPELRKEVSEMHPILRLGISTFVLIDREMIVTDASRKPEDYRKMGLKTANNSLHYVQKDGYAYAVDLRTNNRNEFRNRSMQMYFWLLGFKTLRHVGTDDHLHISLHCHDKPWAK